MGEAEEGKLLKLGQVSPRTIFSFPFLLAPVLFLKDRVYKNAPSVRREALIS